MQKKLKGALSFVQHEAGAGALLLAAAILALVLSNSPLAWLYDGFLDTPVTVRIGTFGLDKPLLLWINDGLMAVFFFLVGLEIKRELLQGELSTFGQAILPVLAAIGGMIVPALVYIYFNSENPAALKGWAIPTATDIAFALGVLALLGPRVPPALKIFLLAFAIIDDLGAILIIALFYTGDLSLASILLGGAGTVLLWLLNRWNVRRAAPYVLIGIFVWACVLKSGVHATIAGIIVALAIPLRGEVQDTPLLEQLEENLHPWVALAILPLFAFANAGVSLAGLTPAQLFGPIPLGIALGLVLGKPIGIFGATCLAVMAGLAPRPADTSWGQILGAAILGGIGFTMSLFIGMLAFPDAAGAAQLRIGVLCGSLVSAVAGYTLLRAIGTPMAARR